MKIYKANAVLGFSVLSKGRSQRVSFLPCINGAYLSVTDEDLAKALESHPWYGDKFYCETIEDSVTDEVRAKELVSVEEVNSCPTAQDFLKSLGVAHKDIKSKDQIFAKASELGYVFPNLK